MFFAVFKSLSHIGVRQWSAILLGKTQSALKCSKFVSRKTGLSHFFRSLSQKCPEMVQQGGKDDMTTRRKQTAGKPARLVDYVQHKADCVTNLCQYCKHPEWLHDRADDIDEVSCVHQGMRFTPRTDCTCGLADLVAASGDSKPDWVTTGPLFYDAVREAISHLDLTPVMRALIIDNVGCAVRYAVRDKLAASGDMTIIMNTNSGSDHNSGHGVAASGEPPQQRSCCYPWDGVHAVDCPTRQPPQDIREQIEKLPVFEAGWDGELNPEAFSGDQFVKLADVRAILEGEK
jgi:hypothetical protein